MDLDADLTSPPAARMSEEEEGVAILLARGTLKSCTCDKAWLSTSSSNLKNEVKGLAEHEPGQNGGYNDLEQRVNITLDCETMRKPITKS